MTEVKDVLRIATEAIELAQDNEERGLILADLLMQAAHIAQLLRTDEPKVQAFVLRVRAIRGMAGQIDPWFGTIKRLAKEQRRTAETAAAKASKIETASLDALTEGVVQGLMAPLGYRVDGSGVEGPDGLVCAYPLIISAISQDIHTSVMHLTVSWCRKGRWTSHTDERGVFLDQRRLIPLSTLGLPVSSTTAPDVVRYLSAFETANLPLIRQRSTSSHMGWQSDRVFVLGAASVGGDIELVTDAGLVDAARGFMEPGGTFDGWCEGLPLDRPMVMLGVYAAACTPLLRILGASGFIVDWSGATSRGKSTTLEVAASVWGEPEYVVGSWSTASTVGPMEMASLLRSLPVILDDTKRAPDILVGRSRVIGKALFDLPAGVEPMRGKASGGLRIRKRWLTCMLSTGEKAVVDYAPEDRGAFARTICIRGTPFGKDTKDNRKLAERTRTAMSLNHGHMGRLLLRRLVEGDHDGLRDRYTEIRESYGEEAEGSVSGRLSASVAVLRLAAELCHDLGMPGDPDAAMEVAWRAALEAGESSDRPAEAMRELLNWCTANADQFKGPRVVKTLPALGWAGVWDRNKTGGWTDLWIFPNRVRRLLADIGADRIETLREWKRRGWLDTNPGRFDKRMTACDGRPALVCLNRDALEWLLS